MKDLLYVIKANTRREDIIRKLYEHPEIKFVSLMGIDLAGNDTDEKIPVNIFIKNMDKFYSGLAVQTDGSSVVLPGIATLNNAKVDIPIDPSVNWFVDYNFEHRDTNTNLPIGTLRIPSFLIHNGERVDSRAILIDTLECVRQQLIELFHRHPKIDGLEINGKEIEDIVFTSATELEFWVKTPLENVSIEEMSAAEIIHEQYWGRTHGIVRRALEQSILLLNNYGLNVEMGHKEVGGIKAQINELGHLTHVCEQLEIDWKFDSAVQAADNDILVRTIIKEIFQTNGLEVIFKAKPMVGLAGNGKHLHIGLVAVASNGTWHNLFSAKNPTEDYMNAIGYGALMGLLKNYEVINPFVSATNDSLNRLKAGFEAPICIVTSLGHSPKIPSRNRTVLIGLIRDLKESMATRFELRSCNPYSNIYLVLAAAYSAILAGIKKTFNYKATELLKEISKSFEEDGIYLKKGRAYRSEKNIFEDYTPEERNNFFGTPPATVWENMESFIKYPRKVKVISNCGALNEKIISAFREGALIRWKTELISRILPKMRKDLRKMHKNDSRFVTDLDSNNWNKISQIRTELAKDSTTQKSLFTRLVNALNEGEYNKASKLQVKIYEKFEELKKLYDSYEKNRI